MALQPRDKAVAALQLGLFELDDSAKPLLRAAQRRAKARAGPRALFASMSSAGAMQQQQQQQRQRQQQQQPGAPDPGRVQQAFMVASAAEGAAPRLEGVPQWRIAAGNLAAGATAGCSVEACEHAAPRRRSFRRWTHNPTLRACTGYPAHSPRYDTPPPSPLPPCSPVPH